MGYDLHITRARRWADSETQPITAADWQEYVTADPELELTGFADMATADGVVRYENSGLALWRGHPQREKVWLDCRHGRVAVKNPDEPTIAKMISIADKLGARVQGDDGERYEAPGRPPKPPALSVSERIASWFERLRPTSPLKIDAPPFGVGDRVKDAMGNRATVVAIDLHAMHGHGSIKVRYGDGRELTLAMSAHGLEPLEGKEGV